MEDSKLYVGNLPYSTTAEQLTELFSAIGEVVDSVVIKERDTGRSKGFGFVTMANPELAQRAVTELHETDFGGRKLVVNIARPKREE
jgi:RNA recognition motif-containing protein